MGTTSNAEWPSASVRLTSFDGSASGAVRCFAPDRLAFWDHPPIGISRGAGLSYVAASFADGGVSIAHDRFNRVLDFDAPTHVVEVETGMTLGELHQFAAPRGLFLPVQPGHPRITVGGCIGADVHGKNQFRDGTMIERVESLRLRHPDHGVLELSRSADPDLFALTCGGYGLTGNIVSARLRLAPLPSVHVQLFAQPLVDVRELPRALEVLASDTDMLYSWHDFTTRGSRFGNGLIIGGRFEPPTSSKASAGPSRASADSAKSGVDSLPGQPAPDVDLRSSLSAARRGVLPCTLLNRWSMPLVNWVYRRLALGGAGRVPLHQFLFPVFDKSLYFYLFGRRGFHECQLLMPAEAFPEFVEAVRQHLRMHPVPVTLASGKLFGGERDRLRFSGRGICFSLNLPRTPAGVRFADFLDTLLPRFGVWPNIIKDSRLTAPVVSRAYPEYERFRQELRAFDPHRRYRSELSERLAL